MAHRGASGYEPEHSFPAYNKAIHEMNIDYLELDLQITKDNNLVVMHDESIDRTTNGKGRVEDYTIEELKKLKLRDKKNQNLKVPTLDEVLDQYGNDVKYYIELKNAKDNPNMAHIAVEKLKNKKLFNSKYIVIQAFDDKALKTIKNENENIPLVKLIYDNELSKLDNNMLESISSYSYAVGVSHKKIDRKLIESVENNAMQVHAFTVNSRNDYKSLKKIGVKGFFTNYGDDIVK
ncbi:glycerophosphodiester phosphodiesterase family protein [Staphylococcus equorum]|uniref:glycerophosphodiester phosphodiesterase family protein n=1 Tax=Staphylococcus equorum TaxID=246432 RepID=UPI002552B7FE|nr:glycerophosphodiester phosphodiesterase family protein [Staphylococcus equorum]MDK9870404.1 glycerophosphodiester phosphodiesterase family protein [Staphylococcus equorum]MDK9878365.1 glycerophosphodiester phosphodiesterase family protein [Staphylococcus equorum]